MSVDVTTVYEEIASDEGKILHCYTCSEGHKTVGIGHLVRDDDPEEMLPVYGAYDDVPEGDCITEERCYELFQHDVQEAIEGCESIYSCWDDLPQEAKHILVNMVFQMGKTGVSRFLNMNAAIEAHDWGSAAAEMMDSRWATQTPSRAERLQARMLSLKN